VARRRGPIGARHPLERRHFRPAGTDTRAGFGLGQALFLGLLALAKEIGQTVPDIAPDTAPTGSEAVAIMRDLFGHIFPNPQGST
jgi:hypothetical protein